MSGIVLQDIAGIESELCLEQKGPGVWNIVIKDNLWRPMANLTLTVQHGVAAIHTLIVDSEHRGKGIARLLLSEAQSLAKKQGADRIQACVNEHNADMISILCAEGFFSGVFFEKRI